MDPWMPQDPFARRRGGGGGGGEGGVGVHQEVGAPLDPSIPFSILSLTSEQQATLKNGSCSTPSDIKFPAEKLKTLMAAIFLYASGLVTNMSLAIVHDRLPNSAPLPDVLFDLLPKVNWAIYITETIMIISFFFVLLIGFFHKHRFIVLRRIFLIVGMIYIMRSITIYVTLFPVSSTTKFCSPKENSTSVIMIYRRVMHLNSGFGLNIAGKNIYCGDYIFSGHTVILTMFPLIISEYTPRRWYLLHWATWLSSIIGMIGIIVFRSHYTIDVIAAYYITTRIFWIYHTMANNQILKDHGTKNLFTQLWWFHIFKFFERNVEDVVPRHFEWPLPWPRRWLRKTHLNP